MNRTKRFLSGALGACSLFLCGCGGGYYGPCFAAENVAASVAPCGPVSASVGGEGTVGGNFGENVGAAPIYEPSELEPCGPVSASVGGPVDVPNCDSIGGPICGATETNRVVCSGGVCRVVAPSPSPCERRADVADYSFARTFERTLKRSNDRDRVRERIAARSFERRSKKSGGRCLKRRFERNRSERVRFDVGTQVAPCGPIE